jgi:hypothetical protein
MLIEESGCPDLIIARQLLLADFRNTIGTFRKHHLPLEMTVYRLKAYHGTPLHGQYCAFTA